MAIRIEVTGVDNFSGTGRKVAGAVGKLKSKTEAAGAAMEMTWKDVALAVGALYIAFNKAKQIFDDLVNKYEKQILAETKLQSALVATGHAAGFTELQLKKMAAGMAEFTTYTDEALIEAEGLLLTFTQIGKDIFPQALEAAADMSAMFGQELKQSVIQLGTALNDPIQGIGRLRRIGISFTQEQKEMIKGFVELGDVMSAQQVIIDEINREFGGVARLMGETAVGAFRRLENKWVDLQEKAGQALLEGITPLFEVIEDFIAFLEKNIDVFTQVGQAIAFVGAVIINIIKFVIQFKEAIITFITIVWGLPAVLGAVSTAFGILNTVILANPFALVAAAIVGVIAAIAGMVGETIKANEELKKLKAEANELAEGELRKAARGLVKDMGELQTALAKARDEITKLEEAAINAGRKELDSLLDLISTYIDLQRKIEAQIKIRKEIELLERAQRDEINNLNEINQALDIAERKWMENARVLAEMIQYMREGEGLSDEVIIADESVKKLQQNIKYWQELIDQIKNTEKEIETYGAEWKKVVEQRIKMEEDFAQKYFQLVSDRITILEYERSEAVKKAQEIGAGTYNILRFYNEQIRREKEKEAQKRTEFEQEYSNKLFQLTADRVEILEWERQQATSKAAEMGAGIASVNAYYDEMVRRAKEELAQAEIETEQEKLLKLKQEQEAYARERMALEKEVHEYILSLADQALLSESRRLENQKQQEITRIEEVAEKWRRSIGYMVSAAGDIVIPFEKIEFSELLDGTDEVIDRTGEWNALYEQAYENERKINSAITSILLKYHELIEAAEREEELLRMIGEAHLDDFKLLEKITEEMKTQEQIRREQIESQIKGLEGLIRSVRTNLDLLQPGAIIEKLEYERIIRQANDAIVYLKTELAKIPTQVDIAFLELSEKVGSILEKYKDPLKKKKEALELEAKMVAEYVLALRKRYEEQTAYLRTLDKTSEEFLKGYAELYNLARAIREAEDVSAEIEKALSEAGKEIADAGKEVKKYSIKSFRQMIDEFVIGISKTLINLPQVIAEVFVAVGKSVAGFFTGAFKLLINPVKEMETIFNSLVSGMENATWNLIDSLKGLYDAIFAEGIERYAEGRGKTVEELTPEEQKAARVFAGLDMFANILNWIVSQLVDIVASTEVFRQYMSDFGEALRIVIETAVIPLIQALHPLIVVVVQVVQIIFQLLVPVFQIFGKVIQMLMPLFVAVGQLVINIIGVLRMFIPIMAVIVVTVGKVLTPIVEALANVFAFLGEIVGAIAPVFDAIGYVVDAVGRVFRTMFVIVEFLTSPFKALGELIYYIVTFQWGKIGKIHIMSPAELADALEDIWSEGWTTGEFEGFDVDFEDVPALELEIEDISDLGAEDFGATVYGGNVSVQQAPDIYIYQTFDGNIIGAGGMVEVGEFVVEAIREYVGAGGQVVWEEG